MGDVVTFLLSVLIWYPCLPALTTEHNIASLNTPKYMHGDSQRRMLSECLGRKMLSDNLSVIACLVGFVISFFVLLSSNDPQMYYCKRRLPIKISNKDIHLTPSLQKNTFYAYKSCEISFLGWIIKGQS